MSANQPNMIRLSEAGTPFASEQAAREYIKAEELDRTNFVPKKYQGGWAVIDLEATMAAAAGQMAGDTGPKADEEYYEVEFNQAGSTNDCPHVPLIVNNWDVRVQRGKPVILPNRFLEAAKCATQVHYVPDESASGVGRQPLKAQGTIMRYPFRVIRKATRKEFEAGLMNGNAIQNDWLASLKRSAP